MCPREGRKAHSVTYTAVVHTLLGTLVAYYNTICILLHTIHTLFAYYCILAAHYPHTVCILLHTSCTPSTYFGYYCTLAACYPHTLLNTT